MFLVSLWVFQLHSPARHGLADAAFNAVFLYNASLGDPA